MINTKELTIGCYVKVNGKPYKVDETFNNAVGLEKWDTLFISSDLEPIPITKELLLKNGFEEFLHFENIWEYFKDFGEYTIRVIDDGILDFTDKMTVEITDNSNYLGIKAKYIHQVQTFCNVLGIDLKLEL